MLFRSVLESSPMVLTSIEEFTGLSNMSVTDDCGIIGSVMTRATSLFFEPQLNTKKKINTDIIRRSAFIS